MPDSNSLERMAIEKRDAASKTPGEPIGDQTRRTLALGLLSALGGSAVLQACASDTTDIAGLSGFEQTAQELSGSGTLKVVDNATNLRALTGGTTLWIAVMQGFAAAGDGGGGIFYWSTTSKADDGWQTLNAASGTSAGWRRVNAGVVEADSVAELRLLAGGTNKSVAILTGYSTAGDGGGGTFRWSSTSAQDDGGTIFNAGAGNSAGWRRVYSGPINVKWFGAKGDGSAIDGGAIQNAINARGGTVVFPPGAYKCISTITIYRGCRLLGLGAGPGGNSTPANYDNDCAVLEHYFDGTFIEIKGLTGNNVAGVGSGLENLILRQTYGDGSSSKGKCIVFAPTSDTYKASWVTIRKITIEQGDTKDDWEWGIYGDGSAIAPLQGVRDTWIEDVRITSGAHATGAIYLKSAANLFFANSLLNLQNANFVIDGTASNPTALVLMSNVCGATLSLNQCATIQQRGGSWESINATATVTDSDVSIGALTYAPTWSAINSRLTVGNYRPLGRTIVVNAAGIEHTTPWFGFRNGAAATFGTLDDQEMRFAQNNQLRAWFENGTGGGRLHVNAGLRIKRTEPPWSGSTVPIDSAIANRFDVVPPNNSPFAIANPTNAAHGQEITIWIYNTMGSALGTITWGNKYRLAPWTSPADGFSRAIIFSYDSNRDQWQEVTRSGADVPE